MGNNLTASCEDMQDDFQSTFSPFLFLDEEGAGTKHLHEPSLLQQHYKFMLKMSYDFFPRFICAAGSVSLQ
jgi:hypothetical protein